MVKITKQSENFSKWYTDVILDADLAIMDLLKELWWLNLMVFLFGHISEIH